MRRPPAARLIYAGLLVLAAASIAAAPDGRDDPLPLLPDPAPFDGAAADAVPGELIVKFDDTAGATTKANAVASAGATVLRPLDLPDYTLVRVPPGREDEYAERLLDRPGVETVETNAVRQTTVAPDDPNYIYQWHLQKIGLPQAWDVATGAGVVVAVLDTGVAYEDCAAAVCGKDFTQAPDFAGTTFVAPYDFVHNDAHPNDEHGHGTHVASTIAETTGNGVGGAGVAYDAQIMPVQVIDATGSGSVADVVDGILYAVDNGAGVINLSLGSPGASATEQVAVQQAVDAGVVVIAASGNSGQPQLLCPACYPGAMAVGATRFDDQRASYSNYGMGFAGHTLDIVAPGGQIGLDQNGDTYADGILQQTFRHFCDGSDKDFSDFALCFAQGTSMAAPHVAGVAALMLSANPDLAPQDVRTILAGTAIDKGAAGYDQQYGYGRVNAGAAVAGSPGATGDADLDGCTGTEELGPDPLKGGQRDPNNFWDFYDVPTGPEFARDGLITGIDFFAVLGRFNSTGDETAVTDALSEPPPPPAYHPAFDRGTLIGPKPWSLGPADGSITGADVFALLAQFSHECN